MSTEQIKMLKEVCITFELTESEVLREAFMEYAKSINLIKARVQGKA